MRILFVTPCHQLIRMFGLRPDLREPWAIKHWFRGDLTSCAYHLLVSSRARLRGIFDPPFVDNTLKAHVSSMSVNHSAAIWVSLCLELWFQAYMDRPSIPVEQETPAGKGGVAGS